MEQIIDPAFIALSGALVTVVTSIIKDIKKTHKYNTVMISAIVSVIMGIVYTLFSGTGFMTTLLTIFMTSQTIFAVVINANKK